MCLVSLQLRAGLKKCLVLKRFADAWMYCQYINQSDSWMELGKAALHSIEIEFGEQPFVSWNKRDSCLFVMQLCYLLLFVMPGHL